MVLPRCILILTVFVSCNSSRIVTTKIPTTTFEADSSVLAEINKPLISYYDLSGLLYLTNNIERQKQIVFLNNSPKLIWCSSSYAVVYPGENIKVVIDKNGELIFQDKSNKSRNNELAYLHAFQAFYQKIKPQFPGRSRDYPIDSILSFEKRIKSEIPSYINRSYAFMDSLASAFDISDSFKMLSKLIFKNEQNAMLFELYSTYMVELKENNMFFQKLRDILPIYNNKTNQQEIDLSAVYYLSTLADNIMKVRINQINSEDEIREAIDTINNNFKNLSRDFILTKLLYEVFYKKIPMSNNNMRYYRLSCKSRDYKQIVENLYTDRQRFLRKSKTKKNNRLIALSDFKVYTLDEIIRQQRTKLILIDIWASWCIPCIEQMPYSKKLKEQFINDKITHIYISIDKQMLRWRQKNEDIGIDPNYSFMFENFDNQSFLKGDEIEMIPRYILIDQNGKIITANAPSPDNPELKKLIEKNLKDL